MNVLLVIHMIVTLVMIGLILLQRSEGGGLGVGGGNGGLGSFATPRATANALSRATLVCFALFVSLSLILAILAGNQSQRGSILDRLNDAPAPVTAPVSGEGAKTAPDDTVAPTEPAKNIDKTQTDLSK